MAQRRKSSRQTPAPSAPGWAWLLLGLGLGLVVAVAAYLHSSSRLAGAPEPGPAQASQPRPAEQRAEPPEESAGTRFDFYEILPSYEVVIPELESQARADRQPASVAEPGRYVLQAGSFRADADADRMQATLALLGVESRIQKVAIDDDVFHRVRIGPLSDLDELNRIRGRLREAQIEVLLMRVP